MGSIGNIANAASSSLFSSLSLGRVQLKHRVALAPLTRFRATKKGHVPIDPLVYEYYKQRSNTPGTFLITEGTVISSNAGGYDNVPGIWNEEQISGWKKITDAVHANGSFVYAQLWALGRSGIPDILKEEGYDHVSSSDVPFTTSPEQVPRALSVEEIKEYSELFAQAAENAVAAGFDGVELHGANGYLIDQFLSDATNKRTDSYGGSVENRSRFTLELIKAVSDRIGQDRTAIRFSPFSYYQEMKQSNPVAQFTHVITELATQFPQLSYIHLIEARAGGSTDPTQESLDFARQIWNKTGRPFLVAGGFTPENAVEHMDQEGHENDVVVFGRWFLANPDLPRRIKEGIPLNDYDRNTFYTPELAKGYIDYPFAAEF